jgi:hypothetical protein
VAEGWYRATLRIGTSDPDRPAVRYPISCLIDGTAPRVDFGQTIGSQVTPR